MIIITIIIIFFYNKSFYYMGLKKIHNLIVAWNMNVISLNNANVSIVSEMFAKKFNLKVLLILFM